MNIAFLVQGLFEISDSIGFDCVYQYRTLHGCGDGEVRLFAERFLAERYPDVPIEPLDAFRAWCDAEPDLLIIYHFCGAWTEMDDFLLARPRRLVLRWHNNTPPWFYLNEGHNNIRHTLAGFSAITRLVESPGIRFWVNSRFTRRQLVALGGAFGDIDVVYPASRYLDAPGDEVVPLPRIPGGPTEILFTSRVVAHKGHIGVLNVASRVQRASGTPVRVHFPGRPSNFKRDVQVAAAELGVDTLLHGEIEDAELRTLYRQADVFVCLSEHEGFGLPIFEAMRCSVPVVAWATSAFEELLSGHPLAFARYDLDRFAGAVMALADPAIRREVLAVQATVAQRYTADVVARQLDDAVANARSTGRETLVTGQVPASLADDPVLFAAVSNEMAVARTRTAPARDGAHDSDRNLVSLYDLAAYRRYFDAVKVARFAPITARRGSGLRITAPEFDSRDGRVVDDAIEFPSASHPAEHLIFGPYLDIPPGQYTICFDFDATVTNGSTTGFEIDVGTLSVGPLVKAVVPQSRLGDAAERTLRFTVTEGLGALEFRLRPTRPFEGQVRFRGVDLAPARLAS